MTILKKITHPAALAALSHSELATLCSELRSEIIRTTAENGGHLASNLGSVELTVAMLRSFDLPSERIIWDVGHQSYAYKLLTGRQKEFSSLRQFNGCCGFPVRNENEFECYGAGHAGVAISAALGMCAAQTPDDRRKIVAVVGDGAIGSGVALEGLNQVREYGRNLVIVLNDNKMAISKNVGSISRVLNRLMTSYRYRAVKNCAKALVRLLPRSNAVYNAISSLESSVKNLLMSSEPFQSLGIRYFGPINGHNIADMERTFNAVCRDDSPVIIHVVTEKGRGFAPAAAAPEHFHGVGKFDPATGEPLKKSTPGFSAAFGKAACDAAEKYPELAAVVAAMTGGVGLNNFARQYPERFYDVGMAESHAVSFASGLAAAGKKVICAVYATFMQRSLDNIFHDVCLMKLPVLFALDRAGLVEDGPTHHGIYDLGFLLAMADLTIYSPACEAEVPLMVESALNLNAPAVIRYPRGSSGADQRSDLPELAPVIPGKAQIWRNGSCLAIYAAGAESVRALAIADILLEKYDLTAQVVNVRTLKPFDEDSLTADLQKMPVFTLEDHVADTGLGGIAGKIAAALPLPHFPLKSFGCPADRTVSFGSVEKLRESLNLDNESIARKIKDVLGEGKKGQEPNLKTEYS